MVTYIGNRCIMTPEGIWSSTKSYEALSLVSHQTTGDGYVSRRAVPTGVDISDDTYWVKMTDFNVQLAAAQAAAEKAEEDAAAALAGVEGKVDATKIITSKEALLALLETGYIADATLVRQLYNELNGKTEELEEDIAAAEGKIGQIVTIPASQTIMSTFVAQKVGTVRQYTYSVKGVPTDYPQAFKDAGINYCPVMTIGKTAESVGMILIQDAKNANGEPHAIFGYTTTTQTFWGSVL